MQFGGELYDPQACQTSLACRMLTIFASVSVHLKELLLPRENKLHHTFQKALNKSAAAIRVAGIASNILRNI